MGDRAERVAVITGAGSGIGAATAQRLARDGLSHIHLVDIDQARLETTGQAVELAGATAHLHVFGVQEDEHWDQLASLLPARVDVLVNNAYTADVLLIRDQSADRWREQLNVNIVGQFLAVRALAAQLEDAGGAIVNVASVHAFAGIPGYSAYAASKGAVLAFTRQLAIELGPSVRVNAVVPGPIMTAAWDGTSAQERQRSAAATALQRIGSADEVAAAIAFLVSPDASFITGSELVVDGGWLVKKDSV